MWLTFLAITPIAGIAYGTHTVFVHFGAAVTTSHFKGGLSLPRPDIVFGGEVVVPMTVPIVKHDATSDDYFIFTSFSVGSYRVQHDGPSASR